MYRPLLLLILLLVTAPLLAQPLIFEAEKVSGPADAWLQDKTAPNKWNLWSTDSDAAKKWSGGVVLQSPPVMADREKPEDGAPVLRTVLTGIPKGAYVIEIKYGRDLGVSLDNKAWRRLSATNGQLGRFDINGTFEFWVDDRYAVASGAGSSYYDFITLTPMPTPKPKFKVTGWAKTRVQEKLGRGMLAMAIADGKVYLGWRLLKSDPQTVGFNVYRATGRMLPVKLNDKPLTQTTDFVDEKAPLDKDNVWFVKPVIGGKEQAASETAGLGPNPEVKPYQGFKLGGPGGPAGDYTFQKVGLGDLNGDGQLDYVIKQPEDNIDPYDAYWTKSPGAYQLEAYLHDGTFLWRHDLGWGIERGIWYSPYVVWDFDGDGKAEIAAKTSEGDPRGADGRVVSGPEYVSIIDGMTGQEKARADWPSRKDFGEGMNGYNLASRNQIGVAYLDGKTPCLIVARGTYTVMVAVAYQYHDGKLQELWKWDNREETDGRNWRGQGAHWMHCGDVDGDGRDEVMLGSCVIDDDGKGLWTTGLGHCDRCFLTDVDPSHPGLEVFYHLETAQKTNGICVVDAKTGEIIWGLKEQTYHVGWGLVADIDPLHPGQEVWACEDPKGDPKQEKYRGNPPQWLFTAQGEVLARDEKVPVVEAVYWDADGLKELVGGGRIYKYQGQTVFQGLEGGRSFWADIIGDWREELISSVKGELRIYTTTIPASDRHVCLLQDPIYRIDVAHLAMGYAQTPMLGYTLKQLSPALWMSTSSASLVFGRPVKVTATLAAPADKAASGKLTLKPEANVTVTPAEVELSAGPGQTAQANFEITLKERPALLYGGKPAVITADFAGSAHVSSVISLKMEEEALQGVPMAQAEAFSEQTGGQVQVRDDKAGAVGKAISHWDTQGHMLQWKITAPQAGKYWLVLRYCAPVGVQRETTVDSLPPLKQTFGGTGGFGSATASDWAHQAVRGADGNRFVFDLTAGEHIIKMVNLDGKGMNLDYLALVPAR